MKDKRASLKNAVRRSKKQGKGKEEEKEPVKQIEEDTGRPGRGNKRHKGRGATINE